MGWGSKRRYLGKNAKKYKRRWKRKQRAKRALLVMRPEPKEFNFVKVNGDLPVAGNVNSYRLTSDIVQGDENTHRNGKRVQMQQLFMRIVLRQQFTGENPSQETLIRLIMIRAIGYTGEYPTVKDILREPGNILSPLNRDNAYIEFRVMFDRFVTLSRNAVQIKKLNYIKKFRKMVLHWTKNNTEVDETAVGPNQIYLYAFTNEVENKTPFIDMYCRTTFIDC